MIFAFNEEGTLEVLEGGDDARRDYEGIDVEARIVTLLRDLGDGAGAWLAFRNNGADDWRTG